ncbi:exopolysaccharide production protein YjbE, partial [Pantoea sp. CTOTU49201]
MKKTVILLGALVLTSFTQVQAATSAGEAAGAQASTTAKGNSDAIGVGAVGALLGVALATMGGGDKG